jgi:hypothetical protein
MTKIRLQGAGVMAGIGEGEAASVPQHVGVRFEIKTEHTATLAGKVALRDFLAGLAREESKPDW